MILKSTLNNLKNHPTIVMKSLTKIIFTVLTALCINVNGAAIYSGADGEWSGVRSHIWSSNASGSPLCVGVTCSPTCNFSGIANIKNKVTDTACSGTLTISG